MEFPNIEIPLVDMVRGVGELIVEEGKLAFHAIFDQLRHETPSEHHIPEVTAVQKDADAWVEQMGFGLD